MTKILFAAFSLAWILDPDPAFEKKFPQPQKIEKKDPIETRKEVLSVVDQYPGLRARL